MVSFATSFLLLVTSLGLQASPSQDTLTLRLAARNQTNRGEWHLAQSTYRRAIQLASTPADRLASQVDLMLLLLRMEDHAAARELLKTVKAQQSSLPPSLDSCRALASIGVAYGQLGEPRAAIAPTRRALTCLEPLLPAQPLDAQRLVLVGIHLQLNDYSQASEVLATIQTPAVQGSAEFLYKSAMISLHKKEYAISESHFRASFAAPDFDLLSPMEKASIYFGYSTLLAKLQRKVEARQTKRKFDELYNEAVNLSGARHKVAWQSLRE